MEVMYILAEGELALVRVLGVIVLIGVLVFAFMLMWADTQEGEEEE